MRNPGEGLELASCRILFQPPASPIPIPTVQDIHRFWSDGQASPTGYAVVDERHLEEGPEGN